MDGNVIGLFAENVSEPRQTVVTYMAPKRERSAVASLIAWGFEELYGKDRDFDPLITPAAAVHVLAVLGALLCVLGGAWIWAMAFVLVILAMPTFCIAAAVVIYLVVGDLDECECGCGMH